MMTLEASRTQNTLFAALIASIGICTAALSDSRIAELVYGDTGFTFEVAPSGDSSFILTAAEDNVVRLWNVGTSEKKAGFTGHTDWVNTIALSNDGSLVASASYDQTVRIWDASSGVQVHELLFQDEQAHDVTFNPTATVVAAATDTGVHLWDVVTGELLRTLSTGARHHATTVSFSPDGLTVVAGTKHYDFMSLANAGRSYLWNVDQVEPVAWYGFQEDQIFSADFSPDGNHVLTSSGDGTVKLWPTEMGGLVRELEPLSSIPLRAFFSPDGSKILVFETPKRLSVWSASTVEQLIVFDYDQGMEAIAFGPDEDSVIFSAVDGTIRQLYLDVVQ